MNQQQQRSSKTDSPHTNGGGGGAVSTSTYRHYDDKEEVETLELAADTALEWLHCNASHGPEGSTTTTTPATPPYYVTQCGHIVCETCLQGRNGPRDATQNQRNPGGQMVVDIDTQSPLVCPACGATCPMIVIGNEMPPDLEMFFQPAIGMLEEALKIFKFQQSNSVKLLRALKRKVEKQAQLLTSVKPTMNATKTELRNAREENQKLKHRNQMLQQQLENIQKASPQTRGRQQSSRGFDRQASVPNPRHASQHGQYISPGSGGRSASNIRPSSAMSQTSTSPSRQAPYRITPDPPRRLSLRSPSQKSSTSNGAVNGGGVPLGTMVVDGYDPVHSSLQSSQQESIQLQYMMQAQSQAQSQPVQSWQHQQRANTASSVSTSSYHPSRQNLSVSSGYPGTPMVTPHAQTSYQQAPYTGSSGSQMMVDQQQPTQLAPMTNGMAYAPPPPPTASMRQHRPMRQSWGATSSTPNDVSINGSSASFPRPGTGIKSGMNMAAVGRGGMFRGGGVPQATQSSISALQQQASRGFSAQVNRGIDPSSVKVTEFVTMVQLTLDVIEHFAIQSSGKLLRRRGKNTSNTTPASSNRPSVVGGAGAGSGTLSKRSSRVDISHNYNQNSHPHSHHQSLISKSRTNSTAQLLEDESQEEFLGKIVHLSICGKDVVEMKLGVGADGEVVEDRELEFDEESMKALGGSLRVLTVRGNRIRHLKALGHLSALEELDLSQNEVQDWEELHSLLTSCESLANLKLVGNPIMNRNVKLRQMVIFASSSLIDFNERTITPIERQFICNMEAAKVARSTAQTNKEGKPASARRRPLRKGTTPDEDDGNVTKKVIPHLPPYASQYRDLMLQQVIANAKSTKSSSLNDNPAPNGARGGRGRHGRPGGSIFGVALTQAGSKAAEVG
ncbi:hypothetical protein HK102_000050 [Quaeritorhiza haematococci]|nr:hypothetical protein HK102_000050 [Quaeritorhiza haematococci]